VGLVGLALVGRVLLGPSDEARARRDAAVFWGGLAAGTALFFVLQDEAYRAMTAGWAESFATSIPSWLRASGEWLRVRPVAAVALTAGCGVLDRALGRPRAWLARRLVGRALPLMRAVADAVVAVLVVSFAGSLFLSYPVLPLVPPHPLTVAERV